MLLLVCFFFFSLFHSNFCLWLWSKKNVGSHSKHTMCAIHRQSSINQTEKNTRRALHRHTKTTKINSFERNWLNKGKHDQTKIDTNRKKIVMNGKKLVDSLYARECMHGFETR